MTNPTPKILFPNNFLKICFCFIHSVYNNTKFNTKILFQVKRKKKKKCVYFIHSVYNSAKSNSKKYFQVKKNDVFVLSTGCMTMPNPMQLCSRQQSS